MNVLKDIRTYLIALLLIANIFQYFQYSFSDIVPSEVESYSVLHFQQKHFPYDNYVGFKAKSSEIVFGDLVRKYSLKHTNGVLFPEVSFKLKSPENCKIYSCFSNGIKRMAFYTDGYIFFLESEGF